MQPEDPIQGCEVQMPRLNISTPRLQVDIRLLTHKLISKTQTVRLFDCGQHLTATHERLCSFSRDTSAGTPSEADWD